MDRWHWQSVYTGVNIMLIEAALPPALCGVAAVISFYFGQGYMHTSSLGQRAVFRFFSTLWLGASVRPFSLCVVLRIYRY